MTKPIHSKKKRQGYARESDLQSLAVQFFQVQGIFYWRMPIGPVIHRRGKGPNVREIWKPSTLAGFPDFAGVLRRSQKGRFWALELKGRYGSPSEKQTHWIRDLGLSGAHVGIARTYQDLVSFFSSVGEISNPQGT